MPSPPPAHRQSDLIPDEPEPEARHRQLDKLASLGLLAAGVAHEINTPAAFVLANTEALGGLLRLIAEKLHQDPAAARRLGLRDLLFEAEAIVQESREGMVRIQRIVRDLSDFFRVEDERSAVSDVNDAVESALALLHKELRHRATVHKELSAARPVRGSAARLGQVFLNLLLNALHALAEGQRARNQIWVRSFEDGDQVVVEVEDNGSGISAEVLPFIFDAFFTTKPPGVGTGLGLSISREIVRGAGGDITVDSGPGGGALFRVRLRTSVIAPARPEVVRTPVPAPARRRYRVLAVDDEMLLLKAYRRILIDHHDLEVAPGGAEALELLARDRRFDVILCDLQMPDLSGHDLYQEVARRWPGLERRFVMITGGAFAPEARRFLEGGMVTTVNKPFQLSEILDLIDRRGTASR